MTTGDKYTTDSNEWMQGAAALIVAADSLDTLAASATTLGTSATTNLASYTATYKPDEGYSTAVNAQSAKAAAYGKSLTALANKARGIADKIEKFNTSAEEQVGDSKLKADGIDADVVPVSNIMGDRKLSTPGEDTEEIPVIDPGPPPVTTWHPGGVITYTGPPR